MTTKTAENAVPEIKNIPMDKIHPSDKNPRSENITQESVQELANSIKEKGLMNPVIVRRVDGGRYEIVAGHRRLAAFKLLKLDRIDASVYQHLKDEDAAQLAIIENVQRKDLPPVDEARAYEAMIKMDKGIGAKEIAEKTGKREAHVKQRLSLLGLGKEGLDALAAGKITLGGALIIARLDEPKDRLDAVATLLDHIRKEGEVTEGAVRELVRDNFMRLLKNVPWKLDDAELLPKAGPCTKCPHNTANQKELFADMTGKGEARCNLSSCFQHKAEAFSASKISKAKKEGRPVLVGDVATKAIRNPHGRETHVKLDDNHYVGGGNIGGRKALEMAMEKGLNVKIALAIRPEDGRAFDVVSEADWAKVREKIGNDVGRSHGGSREKISKAEQAVRSKAAAKERLEREARTQALGLVYEKVLKLIASAGGISKVVEMLAFNRVSHAGFHAENVMKKRRAMATSTATIIGSDRGSIESYFKTLKFPERIALAFEAEAAGHLQYSGNPLEEFPQLGIKWPEAMKRAAQAIQKREREKLDLAKAKRLKAVKPAVKKAKPAKKKK